VATAEAEKRAGGGMGSRRLVPFRRGNCHVRLDDKSWLKVLLINLL